MKLLLTIVIMVAAVNCSAVDHPDTARHEQPANDTADFQTFLRGLGIWSDSTGPYDTATSTLAGFDAGARDRQAGVVWQYQRVADVTAPFAREQDRRLRILLAALKQYFDSTAVIPENLDQSRDSASLVRPALEAAEFVESAAPVTAKVTAVDSLSSEAVTPPTGEPTAAVEVDLIEDHLFEEQGTASPEAFISDWLSRLKELVNELERHHQRPVTLVTPPEGT